MTPCAVDLIELNLFILYASEVWMWMTWIVYWEFFLTRVLLESVKLITIIIPRRNLDGNLNHTLQMSPSVARLPVLDVYTRYCFKLFHGYSFPDTTPIGAINYPLINLTLSNFVYSLQRHLKIEHELG